MKKFWKSLFNIEKPIDHELMEDLVEPNKDLPEPPQFVSLSEEEIQPVVDRYRELNRLQMRLGQVTLDYERRKKDILEKMEVLRNEVHKKVDSLREDHQIPEDDDSYVLTLPTSENPEASFTREPSDHDTKDG